MIDFATLSNHCDRLVGLYSGRDNMIEEIRQQFHMEWKDPPQESWIKKTMSPGPFNFATGAIRLLTSTKPQFVVPWDKTDQLAKTASEKLEQAAAAMWLNNSKALQHPMEYDALASAVLFAEINGSVTKTADLVGYAEDSQNKGNIARMTALAARTPYVFRIYNPATCYADFDNWGLRGHLRRQKVRRGEIYDTWGELAEQVFGGPLSESDRLIEEELNDWYDWECRCVWVQSHSLPIYHDEHGLEFLPVTSQITEGVSFFDSPEKQRMPLLYSVWKSGLWQRSSLMLTIIYSLIFAIGSNPLLKRKTSEPGSPLHINRTIPGGVIDLALDEDISSLVEKVIDPSQWSGLQTADRLMEESTLSKQALGAPPQTAMAFSAISLLAQAGRLPLIGPKELGGDAIADLVTSALTWFKNDGEKAKVYQREKGRYIDLAPEDVPDPVVIECLLEPDIPTDKLQMMNTAQAATNPNNPLASKRWVRENIMNIGQSDQMDKEIYQEKRLELEIQARLAVVGEMLKQKYTNQLGMNQPQAPTPEGQAASEGQPLAGPEPAMMPGAASMGGNGAGPGA